MFAHLFIQEGLASSLRCTLAEKIEDAAPPKEEAAIKLSVGTGNNPKEALASALDNFLSVSGSTLTGHIMIRVKAYFRTNGHLSENLKDAPPNFLGAWTTLSCDITTCVLQAQVREKPVTFILLND